MNSESADGSSNFEIKAESGIIEYEYFDDYLKAVLDSKISSRHYLRENGTAWDIYEYGEGNQLSSIGINGFDNAIVSKLRSEFKGTCRLYELDDALVRFSLYNINKAADESGYRRLINLANDMSNYVEIYNDMEEHSLNSGISLVGNRRVVLNVRMPTKAEFETMSVDLMLDKSSLAKTCYWFAAISTRSIAENTEWICKKLYKNYDKVNEISFTCKRISPFLILLNDFKLKKKSLKSLDFRWVSLIIDNYRVSFLDYLDGNLSDNGKQALVNKYTILREVLVLSGRNKDQKLRRMLNNDKKHIDKIKAEFKSKEK